MRLIDLLIKTLRAENIPVQKVKVKNSTRNQWKSCQVVKRRNQFLDVTLK
ncbi:hypothetical protein [Priestia aryabhattai]|nr:hypothetical protein [Priestia aryabhattai]